MGVFSAEKFQSVRASESAVGGPGRRNAARCAQRLSAKGMTGMYFRIRRRRDNSERRLKRAFRNAAAPGSG